MLLWHALVVAELWFRFECIRVHIVPTHTAYKCIGCVSNEAHDLHSREFQSVDVELREVKWLKDLNVPIEITPIEYGACASDPFKKYIYFNSTFHSSIIRTRFGVCLRRWDKYAICYSNTGHGYRMNNPQINETPSPPSLVDLTRDLSVPKVNMVEELDDGTRKFHDFNALLRAIEYINTRSSDLLVSVVVQKCILTIETNTRLPFTIWTRVTSIRLKLPRAH